MNLKYKYTELQLTKRLNNYCQRKENHLTFKQ